MTVEELTATLQAWQDMMQECDAQMDALSSLAGVAPEAPLPAAVYALMGAYTRTVAELIEWDCDALVAWWCEHNFGERPMNIGFVGEPLQEISSIEALAQFIAEDLERYSHAN